MKRSTTRVRKAALLAALGVYPTPVTERLAAMIRKSWRGAYYAPATILREMRKANGGWFPRSRDGVQRFILAWKDRTGVRITAATIERAGTRIRFCRLPLLPREYMRYAETFGVGRDRVWLKMKEKV